MLSLVSYPPTRQCPMKKAAMVAVRLTEDELERLDVHCKGRLNRALVIRCLILDFLEKRGLKITFFIVGQDAALEKNHAAIRSIADAGHEIGTHSFNHEPWLHLYSEQQIEEDLTQAEEHIERVTGQKPIGFRGPGYSFSSTVLRVLARHGYQYDASTLPTFLGPLARAYYFMTTELSPEEKESRKLLYGEFRDGFQPLRPYRWQIAGGSESLIEIPVTTMPIFRIPFHVSYILYISRFSPALAR